MDAFLAWLKKYDLLIELIITALPILLSLGAICITIHVAREQNKIALFEKKYNCLFQIHLITNFSDLIKDTNNANVILALFDAQWGTDISNVRNTEVQKSLHAKCQINLIKMHVSQAQFLFKQEMSVDTNVMGDRFCKIVMGAIGNNVSKETLKEFCEICENFNKNDFPNMKKELYLKFKK